MRANRNFFIIVIAGRSPSLLNLIMRAQKNPLGFQENNNVKRSLRKILKGKRYGPRIVATYYAYACQYLGTEIPTCQQPLLFVAVRPPLFHVRDDFPAEDSSDVDGSAGLPNLK